MRKSALIAAVAGLLPACSATMPTYQAASGPNGVGHFSAPAENGRQLVVYTGTKDMSVGQVAEYAMLRAAELTLEAGKEWFAVVNSNTAQLHPSNVNSITSSGPVLATGGTDAGASGQSPAGPGVSDASVPSGPTTGGFGGGDVPYQVIERWRAPTVPRATLIIQMGSGSQASFPDLPNAPEIYSAQEVATSLRAKLKLP